MFRNQFKITLRIFSRNKLFTLINIAGLAIGICAYLMITQYVRFEFSYDKYHPSSDNLYRVTLTNFRAGQGADLFATNHPSVGPAMKADFPEVEGYARVVDKTIMFGTFVLSHTTSQGEVVKSNANDFKMLVADNSVLDLFEIPLIRGNAETALREPLSVILSTNVAHRFFGEEDPLDKVLMVNNQHPVKVTGVFKELPQNTHLQFDMLMSFSTLGQRVVNKWTWPEFHNYVMLRPGTDFKKLEAKFPTFIKKYMGEIMNENGFEVQFALQPVKDIHLKSHLRREVSSNASDQTLYFLMIVAGFVIVIALINFINLSTAKSIERAKEVGIKKVIGASKSALVWQFLLESLIVNFIGITLAVLLLSLLMDPFNQLIGIEVLSLKMWTEPRIWIILLSILLSGGLLAGIYPALVFSSFKPVQVLKGIFYQSGKGVLLRKVLVVSQFAISIALIAGTAIVYSQFSYMQNQELGYDIEHNLIVNAPMVVDSTINSKIEVFKNELQRNPNINAITMASDIPGKILTLGNLARRIDEEKEKDIGCYTLTIDHDFLSSYKISLLAGRNFVLADRIYNDINETEKPKILRVMINKILAKTLGFSEAEKAVGERIIFEWRGWEGQVAEVIGVLDDYHQQSLHNNFVPIIFVYPNQYRAMYMTININTKNTRETVEAVEGLFNDFFPHDPYKYFFLEDYFNRQYQADLKFSQICLLFSGLAIFIAILGLFGLGSNMALQKTREISIRKVFGATMMQVLILIPKNLLTLILIAGLIAMPIVYYVAEEWLSNYVFRTGLSLWMFFLPLLMVLVVAAFSILLQSFKLTLINPADSLRNK